jgi:IS1 family transposase
MNVLKPEKKQAVLNALLEGCSIRATSRMTGVHKKTIMRLLVEVGERCADVMARQMQNIHCETIEADELWCFVGKKQRMLTPDEKLAGELGDQYTFVAFDPLTKLVPAFVVGKRTESTTLEFVRQLRARVPNRIQLSTDGFQPYISAVKTVYGFQIDYAQIDKRYEAENPGPGRYSPPKVTAVEIREITGSPSYYRICTSYVERNNLTVRMQIRRFTRLTMGFSRKLRNLKAAVALYFAHYNLCRVHGSLRVTPAMQAGITDHVWTLSDLLAA